MGPSPADQQRREWRIDPLQERVGQANGKSDAQRVAIAGAVLRRDPSRLVGDAHAGGSTFFLELVEPFGTDTTRLGFLGRQVAESVHLEDITQALAVGLDQDGELGVLAGHLQEVMAALTLLPQRRALTRTAPWQE